MAKELICTTCEHVGQPRRQTPGSFVIEVVLWTLLIVPGLVYSLWRLSAKRNVCVACGSAQLVPADSPAGVRIKARGEPVRSVAREEKKEGTARNRSREPRWARSVTSRSSASLRSVTSLSSPSPASNMVALVPDSALPNPVPPVVTSRGRGRDSQASPKQILGRVVAAFLAVIFVIGVVARTLDASAARKAEKIEQIRRQNEEMRRRRADPIAATEITFIPSDVALDYRTSEMRITGKLVRDSGATGPGRVWIWAYFLNPSVDRRGSWSDQPIEVTEPFANGDTATVRAVGRFHWATNSDLPRAGFYARVTASPASAEVAQVPPSSRVLDPAGAVKVRVVR